VRSLEEGEVTSGALADGAEKEEEIAETREAEGEADGEATGAGAGVVVMEETAGPLQIMAGTGTDPLRPSAEVEVAVHHVEEVREALEEEAAAEASTGGPTGRIPGTTLLLVKRPTQKPSA
jgi:hypothetical protein